MERDTAVEILEVLRAASALLEKAHTKFREVLKPDDRTRVARGTGEAHAVIGLVLMDPIYRAFPDLEPGDASAASEGRRIAENLRHREL